MSIFWVSIVFLISFLFLARSSSALVGSIRMFARLFGVSEYTVAFLLMSSATSIPELFIGVTSAAGDVGGISLGNIFGANLLNISLVIGAVALLSGGIGVESKISRANFWLVFILSLFPLFLGADGIISRADGVVLLVSFFIYIWHILGEREYFTKIVNHQPPAGEAIGKTFKSLAIFGGAVAVLLLSSSALVWSGSKIAGIISLSLFSFGVVFISLGTTLPELAFGVRASMRQNGSMAVGNSIGSIAFNSAFIVGLVSIIRPIEIGGLNQFFFVAGAFVVAFVLFNIFVYSRTFISRKEGFLLLGVYFAFLFLEFWLKTS